MGVSCEEAVGFGVAVAGGGAGGLGVAYGVRVADGPASFHARGGVTSPEQLA